MDKLDNELFRFYSNDRSLIDQIVKSKIEAISDQANLAILEPWRKAEATVKSYDLTVEDMSYLQFPNLKLIVDSETTYKHIKERKSLVLTLSLLCPYYTYYFKYSLFTQLENGFLPVGEFVFLNNKKFHLLEPYLSNIDIRMLMANNFPDYKFEDHYYLMNNSLRLGVPYNHTDKSGMGTTQESNPYSLYEYLFDTNLPRTIWN